MYTLSIADFEQNYQTQIQNKSFKMKAIKLDSASLKQIIGTCTHSWRTFKNGTRSSINIEKITAAILDFDSTTTIEEFQNSSLSNYKHVLSSSRNHKRNKGDGKGTMERFHVAFPFSTPMTEFEPYSGLQEGLLDVARAEGLVPDSQVKDLARVFFPARSTKKLKPAGDFVFIEGGSKFINDDINTLKKSANIKVVDNVSSILSNLDDEKLKACVNFLAEYNLSTGLDYNEWVRVAAALHNTNNGQEFFTTISRSYAGTIKDSEINLKWNQTSSISTVGIGTIFYIAYNNGWTYEPSGDSLIDSNEINQVINLWESKFNQSLKVDACRMVLVGSKYKIVTSGYKDRKYSIKTSDIPQDSLFIGIDRKKRAIIKEAMMEVFITQRYLTRDPYVILSTGLPANAIITRDTLTTFLKRETYIEKKFDAFSGRLEVSAPVVNGSIHDDEGAEYVERILNRIFNSGSYDYLPVIKKFLAQLVFEDRDKAKASLVLTGARGVGKSFFIEHIAGGFYDDSKRVYSQADAFNDWAEATKIISVEESGEQKSNLKKLYNEIKDYSGSPTTFINRKHMAPYYSPAKAYFCISTNDLFGFHIADDSESNQQFIVVEFDESQTIGPEDIWHSWGVNTEKVRESLKAYAYKYLIPVYLKMRRDESGFRYGFNTAVHTDTLRKLIRASRTKNDEEIEDIAEMVYSISIGSSLEEVWRYSAISWHDFINLVNHAKTGFVAASLIAAIKKALNLKVKTTRLEAYFASQSIKSTASVKRIKGKAYRGWKTNWVQFLTAKNDRLIELEDKADTPEEPIPF